MLVVRVVLCSTTEVEVEYPGAGAAAEVLAAAAEGVASAAEVLGAAAAEVDVGPAPGTGMVTPAPKQIPAAALKALAMSSPEHDF